MATKKHTLQDIRAEYDRLDAICGIDSSEVPIKITTRAIRQYGCCHWKRVHGEVSVKEITIADFILECGDQFWDTIRHEYAHMLVIMRTKKNHGHDAVWEEACREVGCRPWRKTINKEAWEKSAKRRKEREKYEVACPDCGRSWHYIKAGKIVKGLQKRPKDFHCPCGAHNLILRYI